jgi:hypothetical protein
VDEDIDEDDWWATDQWIDVLKSYQSEKSQSVWLR